MNEHTIRVNCEKGYDVIVAPGLLAQCGERLAHTLACKKLALVTDSNVAGLYLERATASLRKAGFAVCEYILPAGERSKSMSALSSILEYWAENAISRSDCAIALGGGVVGDLTGFAAGCYMRGINYVQMPTTLLAAVDSSVGGKTAVNLRAGKNLAGLFVQPHAVLCDTDCLASLPRDVFADGSAEAIKTGIICDSELFGIFESGDSVEQTQAIISRCVACKAAIAERDVFDAGERALLNLGHTAGHAIERLSGYQITHGRAVAAGLAVISRAAARMGICSGDCAMRIEQTLERNRLPVTTPFTAAELATAAVLDKKRKGDMITLVMPQEIGHCVQENLPANSMNEIFELGMEQII